MNKTFERMFTTFLQTDLFSETGAASAFIQAELDANHVLVPALNRFIASNVAAFPLTSTVAGIGFDLSKVHPEMMVESLGPIYSETAETIGFKNLNFGLNVTYYDLSTLRGLPTEDVRFTFTASDQNGDGQLGSHEFTIPIETETIDIFPDIHLDAATTVFFATYGLTPDFDVALAIPWISLNLRGQARAVINSTTLLIDGFAINSYNNDLVHPVLEDTFSYNESVFGLGDIALRLKYAFHQGDDLDMAGLLDVRFPTADETQFLGTGTANLKFSWIASRKFGGFVPHLNLSYDWRPGDFDSDEIELFAGFDHKISSNLTFVLDVSGEFDLDQGKRIQLFPGTRKLIFSQEPVPGLITSFEKDLDLSNIPEHTRDDIVNASIGFKFAPTTRSLIMGNLLVPLQKGGLRSSIVPVIGAAFTFGPAAAH